MLTNIQLVIHTTQCHFPPFIDLLANVISLFVSYPVTITWVLNLIYLSTSAREEMLRKGIDPDGAEAKLFGRKLLKALTYTFGRCILETGFFHAGK